MNVHGDTVGQITVKIIKATVIKRSNLMDMVVLTLDLPGACYGETNLGMIFYASIDTGEEYTKRVFGIEAEVVRN